MRADRALPEDDQVAGQDIGALHGDADRHRTIETAHVILRAVDHGLAPMDIHRVVDRDPHPLGGVQLHDTGNDGGMMALVECGTGQPPCRIEQIGGAGNAGQRLLDAFEFADGNVELFADAGIGAGDARGIGRTRGRQRRQRDAAAGGERRHQHLPALAEPLLPADDVVHRNEDVAAPVRAVLEHLHRRQMAVADLDAGQMGRDQRHGDAEVFLGADQMIGIVGLEGKTEQRRDRPERDVALVPVEPQAQHFAAFEMCPCR